jgi:hypothetical protein
MAKKIVAILPEHDDEGKNVINHRGCGREFTITANAIFEDDRLSAEAKLVLCWILSKPEGLTASFIRVVESAEGLDAVPCHERTQAI